MPRRAVADHTVGGVDCFVECGAGQPGERHPQHRCDDAVRKIFRKAFDRGAGDAGFVERAGIAADNVRHRRAPGGDAVLLQRGGHIGDVSMQAALRDQAGSDGRYGQNPQRQAEQFAL